MSTASLPDPAPVAVVQRQFEAYNARDLDAWLATYAADACQFDHAGRLLARGQDELRARMGTRFADPHLQARLLRRTVLGAVVVDHERVTRQEAQGLVSVEMMCSYAVAEGQIQTAMFVFGPAQVVAPPGPSTPVAEVLGFDHVYLSVSDLSRAEAFYERLLVDTLGFRKTRFVLAGDPHVQFYNREFGMVLRPARFGSPHQPYAPGLHHACLRVESVAEVQAVARQLQALGIAATAAAPYPDHAPDYWATFFTDPDGIRLEVTNFRAERRERMAQWDTPPAHG